MTTEAVPEVPNEPAAPTPEPAPAPAVTPPPAAPAEPAPPAVAIDYSTLAGAEGVVSDAFVTAVRGLAETHKIPIEAAQGVLDALAGENKAALDGFAAQREAWKAQVKADPAIGDQGLAHVNTWMDTFGSPELRTMLEQVGIADHPLLVAALVKAGKEAGEAPIVPSGGGAAAVDIYRTMYPNSPVLFQ